MKKLIIPIILILLWAGSAGGTGIPASSGTTAQVCPDYAIVEAATNLNGSVAGRDIISYRHEGRIRQNGTIETVRFYADNTVGLTDCRIKIWRKKTNGLYDLVGQSENLESRLTDAVTNTLTLTSPITGVQEGDYVGIKITPNFQAITAQTGLSSGITLFYSDGLADTSDVDWEAQGKIAGACVPIECYMSAPQVIFIGDSITAGHPDHHSFLEASINHVTGVTIPYGEELSNLKGNFTYQNNGIGSQVTADVLAGLTTYCINLDPQVAFLMCGINDVGAGVTTTVQANYNSILNLLTSNDIRVYAISLLPWTNGVHDADPWSSQDVDTLNIQIKLLCDNYPLAKYLDVAKYIGQKRAQGACPNSKYNDNNLWDIKPAYDDDGVHLTISGYDELARGIKVKMPGAGGGILYMGGQNRGLISNELLEIGGK